MRRVHLGISQQKWKGPFMSPEAVRGMSCHGLIAAPP